MKERCRKTHKLMTHLLGLYDEVSIRIHNIVLKRLKAKGIPRDLVTCCD